MSSPPGKEGKPLWASNGLVPTDPCVVVFSICCTAGRKYGQSIHFMSSSMPTIRCARLHLTFRLRRSICPWNLHINEDEKIWPDSGDWPVTEGDRALRVYKWHSTAPAAREAGYWWTLSRCPSEHVLELPQLWRTSGVPASFQRQFSNEAGQVSNIAWGILSWIKYIWTGQNSHASEVLCQEPYLWDQFVAFPWRCWLLWF